MGEKLQKLDMVKVLRKEAEKQDQERNNKDPRKHRLTTAEHLFYI